LKSLVPVLLDVEVAEVAVDLDVEDSAAAVAVMMVGSAEDVAAATEKEVAEAMAVVEEEEDMEAVAEDLAVGTERSPREDGIKEVKRRTRAFLYLLSHSPSFVQDEASKIFQNQHYCYYY
jgi:hypothetical protein